jgi:flagella basal body P-ring formation protein FlgA
MIKAPNVIQRGQSVNVLSIGKNFEIGYEGIALGDAVENQMVQVKVSNGRIVQGFARKGGVVEVRNRGIDSAH